MSVIGIIGILIGIVLLIWLTVKGLHVVILAPVCALIVIVMNQMAPVTSLTEVFMGRNRRVYDQHVSGAADRGNFCADL